MQAAADCFRMRPAINHMRRAQPHEFAAGIGQFLPGPDLRLRRVAENDGEEDSGERTGADHFWILFLNFDGKVADQFAMELAGVAAVPFQEKVPMPGRLESDGPAMDGPHRMKARARTKLVVRTIKSLPLLKVCRAVRWQCDT